MSTGSDVVVLVNRGGLTESVHRVAWSVVDAGGQVTGSGIGRERVQAILPRSAAKPLQALASVSGGVLERFGLGDPELALACASHSGSDEAAEICRSILHACDLREADLRCGTAPPRDPRVEIRAAWGPAHHMCSGNHALALAWCMAEGASPETYLDADAPVQEAMRRAVAEACGIDPASIREAIDGCGMPAYEVPLPALAGAYGRLASGGLGAAGERVAGAMSRNPAVVGIRGGVDTELMLAGDGLVAKLGAEGVLCLGLPDGRGLALKVEDGSERAVGPAAVLLLREVLGAPAVQPSVDALAHPPVLAAGHRVAGELLAEFASTAALGAGFR